MYRAQRKNGDISYSLRKVGASLVSLPTIRVNAVMSGKSVAVSHRAIAPIKPANVRMLAAGQVMDLA